MVRPTNPVDASFSEARWTLPNALTITRIFGTVVLLALAARGGAWYFPWLLVAIVATDGLDGLLAKLLNQRTTLGARLDSTADVLLAAALVACAGWLRPDFVAAQRPLLSVTLATYLFAGFVCLVRLRRWPSYHTWLAKTGWALVTIGAFFLFSGGPDWPCVVALAVVVIGNVEAIAISFVLPRWRANVRGIWEGATDPDA
ncbi:MAG: CDP-alcohol phosphatidyltransferase family protein [Phycisphaerales bacterium]|nr:CDP-alcohol phosphatidyltransferase family protein [Phycisphaerales bacterium]